MRFYMYKRKINRIEADIELLLHSVEILPDSLYNDAIELMESNSTMYIDSNFLKSYRRTYKIHSSMLEILTYVKNKELPKDTYLLVLIGMTLLYGHNMDLVIELYSLRYPIPRQRLHTK